MQRRHATKRRYKRGQLYLKKRAIADNADSDCPIAVKVPKLQDLTNEEFEEILDVPDTDVDVEAVPSCFICKKSVPDVRSCRTCSRRFHHMCDADEQGKVCDHCMLITSSLKSSMPEQPLLANKGQETPQDPDSEVVGLAVSYDMGWAKRGKGHNSLDGVDHAIGMETGRVLSFGTRNKRCATCWNAERLGKQPSEHDCRRNWYGSAKAIEGDVAVQLAADAQNTAKLGVRYSTFVGDDDSSAICKLRKEVSEDIEKWSDVVHAKRSLGKHLYEVRKQHSELTEKNISHVQTCFSYAVRQNKDDPETLALSLRNIPAHLFGDHSRCQHYGKKKRMKRKMALNTIIGELLVGRI